MCFAVFHDSEIVVTGLVNLWARAHSARLDLAGPKSTRFQSHVVARPLKPRKSGVRGPWGLKLDAIQFPRNGRGSDMSSYGAAFIKRENRQDYVE